MTHDSSESSREDVPTDSERDASLLRLEVTELRRKLADALFELDSQRSRNQLLEGHLFILRRSPSWRITWPLRLFKRRITRGGQF